MASSSSSKPAAEVVTMSEDDFWEPIRDQYVKTIADMSPDDVYRSPNPGPTKEDGSMNFECHCVGHLVASPCGYEFREAITCQKASSEKEMEEGACAAELMEFMQCAMRTQCFKAVKDTPSDSEDDGKKKE